MGGVGSGGHNRRSDELKKIIGTYRPDRGGAGGVQVPPGRPACPRWLPPAARAEFKWLCKVLEKQISRIDGGILALYSLAWASYRKTVEALTRLPGDAPERRLWERLWRYWQKEVLTCAKALGLTPASRARLPRPGGGGGPSRLEEFLRDR